MKDETQPRSANFARRSTQFPPRQFVNVPGFFDRLLARLSRDPRGFVLHKETSARSSVSSNNYSKLRPTDKNCGYMVKLNRSIDCN